MLNWNLIDNDKTFQRLTNHLFAVECDSPGFIPSSPYIGADGSWDGYYKGPYPLEKRDGLFSIQSKWTKKSFDDAYKYLGSVIKKELINAKKKKVEHLRISTNAELRVEHVLNLELLATNKVKTLIIWHRERLTIRIEKQAYLRFLFFKDYQHPALVDSASYYKDIEQHLLSKTLIRPSLDECEHKLERFMGSDSLKIFLLHSSGGCGKSHFLGNIFPILRKVDFQRQVWFVKPSLVNTDTFHAEIVSGRKYLLVIDDADRCVEELRSLLNFLWCSGEDIKIVFGSRSSGVYPLTQVIQEMKCFEVMEQFKIDEWDKDELKELLRLVVGKTPVKDEEEIVHYYPNPYLIVWLGSKIKGKKISEFSVLRRKFVEEITNDTRKCLEGFIKIDIEKFVFTLACITPFYYEDKRIIDKIALYFEVKPDIICAAIERLVAAGILRQVGRTVRFNPDMKGDIYLSYKLESIEEHILKPFILYWIAVVPNNIFVNIGSASKYGEINKVKVCLSEILSNWENCANESPLSQRREYLKLLEDVAILVPEESISLLSIYLEMVAPDETNPYLKGTRYELTTDDYGPVLLRLMRVSRVRRDVLDFIDQIADAIKKGTYGNYHIEALVSEFVCPLRNNINDILSGLEYMESWVEKDTPIRLDLLETALKEVLAATHEVTRSFLDKFYFGERSLLNHPKVIAMRDKAITIVDKMLDSESSKIKIRALNIIKRIGRMKRGCIGRDKLPLNDRIIEEMRHSVKKVSTIVNTSKDFKFLSAVEDVFIHFWATGEAGTNNVVEFLRKMPRTPEYIIYKSFVANDVVIENFAELEREAPEEGRWNWFVSNARINCWQRTEENYSRVAGQLNIKYRTPDSIASYLKELGQLVCHVHTWRAVIFLNVWVRLNSDSFRKIRKSQNLWKTIPEMFQNQIDCMLINIDEKYLSVFSGEFFSSIPNISLGKLSTFLGLIHKYASQIPWSAWIKKLIYKGKQEWYPSIIQILFFIAKDCDRGDESIDLVMCIIDEADDITKQLIDELWFFVGGLKKDIKADKKNVEELHKKIVKVFFKRPKLDWHEQELLNTCVTNIDQLLVFISGRLDLQTNAKNVFEFNAIPFEGITALEKMIMSYSDYVKFIEQIEKWNKKEKCKHDTDFHDLVKPVALRQDEASGEIYHVTYIRQLLTEGNIETALFCLEFLPLTAKTEGVFIEVGERGIKTGFQEKIKTILRGKTYPENGWSSSSGEVPPALEKLENSFRQMQEKAKSMTLKLILKRCMDAVRTEIKESLDRDAEYNI